ncbi:MAG: type ISP restriction/modification enzyme [Candidatus Magasanikbacteria bacterium]
MQTKTYFREIKNKHQNKKSGEHSYRKYLQDFIEKTVENVEVTNEPKRKQCGAPDYIIEKGDIPLGYIEAKDIGKDLDKVENSEQLKRYRESLENLILTDYVEFRIFRNGEKIDTVKIAELENGKLQAKEDNFSKLQNIIKDFCSYKGQTIKSSKKLANMMAAKARLMKDVFYKTLNQDEENTLKEQLEVFQDILISDMDEKQFADIYAQTICYGMFAARLHDDTLDDFSRQEARDLVPKTNPFLRRLFDYVAGPDLEEGVKWIVDELAEVFRATNVRDLLEDFGSDTQQNDPMIHFYETFLSEYNPKLRKSRGVYYTPEPIVNFIVRAVDDVLKDEFDLADGLANTDKTEIEVNAQGTDKRRSDNQKKRTKEVHKVQILDPAAGTGTFLAEVIRQIHKKFQGQEGIWPSYVEQELIPRLNGFELMMAPYAMCHLKLDMMLRETGYEPTEKEQRLKVFLTNSLEEAEKESDNLFMAKWLSNEAREANVVKRDMPIMVVLGNPPYSGVSKNKGDWIMDKIEEYKYIEGEHFGEKKHWLNDDYVKFIRFAEHFVEENNEGVVSYITNHGYLDNPTFRGMRYHLMKTFDKIYVIDLHGNTMKKETTPEGGKDENVFDIQQGVAMFVGVKNGEGSELADVYHADVWGKREEKYNFVLDNDLDDIEFKKIEPQKPRFIFKDKNYKLQEKYNKGFKIDELFSKNVTGLVTSRDSFVIDTDKNELSKRIKDFCDKSLSYEDFQSKYDLSNNYQWKCKEQREEVGDFDKNKIQKITYRPFDNRYIYYQDNLVFRMRKNIVKHLLHPNNISLIASRQAIIDGDFTHVFVSKFMCDNRSFYSNKGIPKMIPLYLYENSDQKTLLEEQNRKPNLDEEIVEKIADKIELEFTPEKTDKENTFAPVDLLDYIYAVLHSPSYREKYKEFLKSDFPRVPYPENAEEFWAFAEKGSELRSIHLMESDKVDDLITSYPESGDNKVEKYEYEGDEEKGKVWINDEQYFDDVPKKAWEFYIGGYQPAQKWLKYRKGEKLSPQDILHWQKMIVALNETDGIMGEVGEVKEF